MTLDTFVRAKRIRNTGAERLADRRVQTQVAEFERRGVVGRESVTAAECDKSWPHEAARRPVGTMALAVAGNSPISVVLAVVVDSAI
jgi:hypothetical protein